MTQMFASSNSETSYTFLAGQGREYVWTIGQEELYLERSSPDQGEYLTCTEA